MMEGQVVVKVEPPDDEEMGEEEEEGPSCSTSAYSVKVEGEVKVEPEDEEEEGAAAEVQEEVKMEAEGVKLEEPDPLGGAEPPAKKSRDRREEERDGEGSDGQDRSREGSPECLYKCTACTKSFNGPKEFYAHVSEEHQNGEVHRCKNCGKPTKKQTVPGKQGGIGEVCVCPIRCPGCWEGFGTQMEFRIHIGKVSSKGKFRCSACPCVYTTRSAFITHVQCHTSDSPVSCHRCGKVHALTAELRTHLQGCRCKQPKDFRCPFPQCTCLQFETKIELFKHHRRYHRNKQPLHCPECRKEFFDKNSFWSHQKLHKEFRCYICNQAFQRKSYHDMHVERTHPNAPPAPEEDPSLIGLPAASGPPRSVIVSALNNRALLKKGLTDKGLPRAVMSTALSSSAAQKAPLMPRRVKISEVPKMLKRRKKPAPHKFIKLEPDLDLDSDPEPEPEPEPPRVQNPLGGSGFVLRLKNKLSASLNLALANKS